MSDEVMRVWVRSDLVRCNVAVETSLIEAKDHGIPLAWAPNKKLFTSCRSRILSISVCSWQSVQINIDREFWSGGNPLIE